MKITIVDKKGGKPVKSLGLKIFAGWLMLGIIPASTASDIAERVGGAIFFIIGLALFTYVSREPKKR